MNLSVTVFPSLTTAQGKQHEISWEKLVERLHKAKAQPKESTPLIKLGTFTNESRGDGEVLETVYGLEGDYDAGEVAPETAAALLRDANVKAVVATTGRHTPEAPRWRVLAPLSGPYPAKAREELLDRLDSVLGFCLANESWTEKQVWFFGNRPKEGEYLVIPVDGELTVDQLPEAPPASPPKEAQKQPQNRDGLPGGGSDRWAHRWDALKRGEDVHANARELVAAMVARGDSEAFVTRLMEDAVRPMVVEARGEQRADELMADLPRMIEGAARKYRQETGEPTAPQPAPIPPLDSLRVKLAAANLTKQEEQYPGSVPMPKDWKLMVKALEQNGQAKPKLPRGLHVFAGQTGCGKTQLATGFTRAALLEGHPVVYLSLELSQSEVAARLVALETSYATDEDPTAKEVGWPILAQGASLAASQRKAVDAAVERLDAALDLLYVWSPEPKPGDPPASVATLRELVEQVWKKHAKTPLLVVDHLQAPGLALDSTPASARLPLRERVAGITMALRHISKESEGGWAGCPVVVLSLVARHATAGSSSVPGFDGKDPDLMRRASLETLKALPKEAGEIEATAVTSWAMASSPAKDGELKARMALRLAKSRMTRAGGWIPLDMEGFTGRLRDAERRYATAAQEDEKAKKDKAARKAKREGGE